MNRYSNILPYTHTEVKVKVLNDDFDDFDSLSDNEDTSSYINANYVNVNWAIIFIIFHKINLKLKIVLFSKWKNVYSYIRPPSIDFL